MNSFIYGKENNREIFSSILTRDYTYKVKEKEIEKMVPEFYIESIFNDKKVSIDFLALITIDELNSFDLDDEIYFNDYIISSELFVGFDTDYKNISVSDIDIFITKIDINYFNVRIEIPKYEIIVDNNYKYEDKDDEMQMGESEE